MRESIDRREFAVKNALRQQNLMQRIKNGIGQLKASYDDTNRLNKIIQRFVPVHLLPKIMENIEDFMKKEIAPQEISILFLNFHNFTNISEPMVSNEVLGFLNSFIGQMEPCIINHEGSIDKFIGDTILAVFEGNNQTERAVQAAVDMVKELNRMNTEREKQNRFQIEMGIGIHTGPVLMGVIGNTSHFDSTTIGDPVNVASRLGILTKNYRFSILISEQAFIQIKDCDFMTREIDTVQAQGHSQKLTIYEVFDADPVKICEKKQLIKATFESAVILFKSQMFSQAREFFLKCYFNFAEEVSLNYAYRCYQLMQYPPRNIFWNGFETEEVLSKNDWMDDLFHYPISCVAEKTVKGFINNISKDDLLLYTDKPFEIGQKITIAFVSETLVSENQVSLMGKIIWQKKIDLHWNIGLKRIKNTGI